MQNIKKAQGSLENLLIISAAIIVVAVVIIAVYGIMTQGNESVISGEDIKTGTTGTLREMQGVEIQTVDVPADSQVTITVKPSATDDKLKNMFKGAPNGTGFTVNNGPNSGSTCQRTATGWVDANGNGCNTPITSGTNVTISTSGGSSYHEEIRGVGTGGTTTGTFSQAISPGTPTTITAPFNSNAYFTDVFSAMPIGTIITVGTSRLTRTATGWVLTLQDGTIITDPYQINQLIPVTSGTVFIITSPTQTTITLTEGTPPAPVTDSIALAAGETIALKINANLDNNTLNGLFPSMAANSTVRKVGTNSTFTYNGTAWSSSGGTTPAQFSANLNDTLIIKSTGAFTINARSFTAQAPLVTKIIDTTGPTINSIYAYCRLIGSGYSVSRAVRFTINGTDDQLESIYCRLDITYTRTLNQGPTTATIDDYTYPHTYTRTADMQRDHVLHSWTSSYSPVVYNDINFTCFDSLGNASAKANFKNFRCEPENMLPGQRLK